MNAGCLTYLLLTCLTNPVADIHSDSLNILFSYTTPVHNDIARFF
jgi:hypothetical protein